MYQDELIYIMFLKTVIIIFFVCLLFNDGSTKLISQRLGKTSWKRKGICSGTYIWKDPSSTGPNAKFISNTCYNNPVPPKICSIDGIWNVTTANRVLIEIETKTTRCGHIGKSTSLCYENMTVLAYTGKEGLITTQIIPKEKVPLHINYFQHNDSFYIDNLTDVNYITTKFLANRYCGTLVQVTVSHHECPVSSGELVDFPPATAPDKNTNRILIKGNCTPNAVLKPGSEAPVMSCEYTGHYSISGSCICKKGFENVSTSCKGKVFFVCFVKEVLYKEE